MASSAQVAQGDASAERDTYKQSRQGLDEMYNEARRQLKEECQLRQVSPRLLRLLPRLGGARAGAYLRLCPLPVRMWRTSWLLRCP